MIGVIHFLDFDCLLIKHFFLHKLLMVVSSDDGSMFIQSNVIIDDNYDDELSDYKTPKGCVSFLNQSCQLL